MTEVLRKENLKWVLEGVKRNKGAPGIDRRTVDELGSIGNILMYRLIDR